MSEKKWSPDTCPCVLLYDDATMTFIDYIVRCREHAGLDGQRLFDGVVTHCAGINNQYSVPPTPTDDQRRIERARIKAMKVAEKDRITRLGPPDINPSR